MKIKTLELSSGLIVNFDKEVIEIIEKSDALTIRVHVTTSELETIRDTYRSNQRAENLSREKESAGGNGILTDKVKSAEG